MSTRTKNWLRLLGVVSLSSLVLACSAAGDEDGPDHGSVSSEVAGDYGPTPLPEGSIWASPEACETAVASGARETHSATGARLATWNLRWFPTGTPNWNPSAAPKPTNVTWLACTIAWLDVDMVEVEEIQTTPEAKTAMNKVLDRLKELTGGDWRAEIDTCSRPNSQHLGYVYDARRVQLSDVHGFHWRDTDGCNITRRPGLAVHATFASGLAFNYVAVHQKAMSDADAYEQRREQAKRLSVLQSDPDATVTDSEILVSGDFNNVGCSGSGCPAPVDSTGELHEFDQLVDDAGFSRVEADRGCSIYEGNSKYSLIDHFVANEALKRSIRSNARVSGFCGALACAAIPRGTRPLAQTQLSDHCPVLLDIAGASAD